MQMVVLPPSNNPGEGSSRVLGQPTPLLTIPHYKVQWISGMSAYTFQLFVSSATENILNYLKGSNISLLVLLIRNHFSNTSISRSSSSWSSFLLYSLVFAILHNLLLRITFQVWLGWNTTLLHISHEKGTLLDSM